MKYHPYPKANIISILPKLFPICNSSSRVAAVAAAAVAAAAAAAADCWLWLAWHYY